MAQASSAGSFLLGFQEGQEKRQPPSQEWAPEMTQPLFCLILLLGKERRPSNRLTKFSATELRPNPSVNQTQSLNKGQTEHGTCVSLALERLGQGDPESQATMGSIWRPCLKDKMRGWVIKDKMARCLRCLLCKHEDLSLDPSVHVKTRCGSIRGRGRWGRAETGRPLRLAGRPA